MRNACARKELFASVNACYFILEVPKKVVPSKTRSRRAIVISLMPSTLFRYFRSRWKMWIFFGFACIMCWVMHMFDPWQRRILLENNLGIR